MEAEVGMLSLTLSIIPLPRRYLSCLIMREENFEIGYGFVQPRLAEGDDARVDRGQSESRLCEAAGVCVAGGRSEDGRGTIHRCSG